MLTLSADVLIGVWKDPSTPRPLAPTLYATVIWEVIRTIVEDDMGVAEEGTRTTSTTTLSKGDEAPAATEGRAGVQIARTEIHVARTITSQTESSNQSRKSRNDRSGWNSRSHSSTNSCLLLSPMPWKLLHKGVTLRFKTKNIGEG